MSRSGRGEHHAAPTSRRAHLGAPALIQSEMVAICAVLKQELPLQLSGMRAIDSSAPLFLQVALALTTDAKKLPAALLGTTSVVPLQ